MKQATDTGSALAPAQTVQPNRLLHDVMLQTPARPARADGIAVGILDGIGADGSALVSIATFGLSRIRARSIRPLAPADIGQALALGFEGGDPMQPIILGLMLAAAPPPAPAPTPPEVLLDGERVVLSAAHEIELRCGDAALILSADGRIHMRGTYITSHASATQRILGGSVNIN
jgi:hypothetical protein